MNICIMYAQAKNKKGQTSFLSLFFVFGQKGKLAIFYNGMEENVLSTAPDYLFFDLEITATQDITSLTTAHVN